jgi:serine/threonine-protein kinase HipA
MGDLSIKVNLWGLNIGELWWCQQSHSTLFSFSESYFESGLNAFPLIADNELAKTNNLFHGRKEPIFKFLPSFLAESLPDSWEREYIMKKYCGNDLLSKEINPIKKLAYIRNRCLGALEYQVKDTENNMSDLYWFNKIADEYDNYLKKISIPSLNKTDLGSICSLGTCSVGLRPKVLLAICRETGEIRSGQVEQENNYDYYILKIGDVNSCLARIEMSYYQIAMKAGIHMMPSNLVNIDRTSHFLTKRYDRVNGNKIHMQSFSALSPQSSSYEELFELSIKLNLAEKDIIELYRRLLFNILLNNVDDHARNFSFLMNIKGEWSLSPAYDISYPVIDHNNHYMTLNGKCENFKKDDVLSLVSKFKIINHEAIYSDVLSAISCLNDILERNNVDEKYKNNICRRVSENIRHYLS